MERRTYAGEKARSLRHRLGLSQRAMADLLGISVSYISQIESDDRPITEAVLAALSKAFPGDWADFSQPADQGLLGQSLEALHDYSISGPNIPEKAIQRAIKRHRPVIERLVNTHSALTRVREQLRSLSDLMNRDEQLSVFPWEEARDWFHSRGNYIDILDRSAESLSLSITDEEMPSQESFEARLRHIHGVTVKYVEMRPRGVIRRMDRSTQILFIERSLARESQKFSLAHELARLELQDVITHEVDKTDHHSSETRKLLSIGLVNYAAGALIMPYTSFRALAHAVRHDVDALKAHFSVSFEQVCHRLSTLQRPGAFGIPFFFCRVDLAGNITKRHSATRLQFARYGGTCPLWIVHEAVAIPDRILVQLAETPDGVRYVSMAKGFVKPSNSYRQQRRRYAVALGCEVEHAPGFIYADEQDITKATSATRIGVSCRICPRDDCDQRAFPPAGRLITFDRDQRATVPYTFE